MVKSPTNAAKEEITKSFDKAAINAPADLKDTAQEDDVELLLTTHLLMTILMLQTIKKR